MGDRNSLGYLRPYNYKSENIKFLFKHIGSHEEVLVHEVRHNEFEGLAICFVKLPNGYLEM